MNDFLKEYFMDCKEYVTPTAQKEVVEDSADETADKVMNIVRSMTSEIYDRLNAIARYVGIPCRVNKISMQSMPAIYGGDKVAHAGYVGYTVDVKHHRDAFAVVRFAAAAPINGEHGIVRGMIIDDEGNVECVASCSGMRHEWTRLPLTQKSSLLVATVPLDEAGAPVFTPEYVEFLPDGLVQNLSEYMSEIVGADNKLCERVDRLEKQFTACNCPCRDKL